jgi:hypothetical protein
MDMFFTGFSLSAACGFRIFVPFFVLSCATLHGDYTPHPDFAWLSSPLVAVALGLTMTFELTTYYIPFVDDFFDILATPAAIGAGIVLAAAELGTLHGALRWLIALFIGGSIAGVIQLGTVSLRRLPLAHTATRTNLIVSTIELLGSSLLSILSLFAPLFSFLVSVLFLGLAIWVMRY